jgi:hypothetical protein
MRDSQFMLFSKKIFICSKNHQYTVWEKCEAFRVKLSGTYIYHEVLKGYMGYDSLLPNIHSLCIIVVEHHSTLKPLLLEQRR